MKKKPIHSKIKLSKTAWILSAIAAALLVTLVVLLLVLPGNEDPDPTTVPTTTMEGTTGTTEATTNPTTTAPTETEPTMLPKMAELYSENPDIAGWITIPGTKIDYPVMFTPEDPEKYIHANFKGKYDVAGLPFMDGSCSMDPESDNLIIYGHHMNNGTQFQNLMNYARKSYWKEHPLIQFSTLYEERTYEIIAAFYDRVYRPTDNVFKFYQFIDAEDEADFDTAMKYYKKKAEYDTGITGEYGDNLITLVTCAYHVNHGRFVVVARQVSPEVEKTVSTETGN